MLPRPTTASPSSARPTRTVPHTGPLYTGCEGVIVKTRGMAGHGRPTLAGQSVGEPIVPGPAKPVKRSEASGNAVRTRPGNQFPGPVRVGTSKSEMVCVPTDVTAVSLAP